MFITSQTPQQKLNGRGVVGRETQLSSYLLELHGDVLMLFCASTSLFKTLSVYKIYIMYIN